MKKVISLDKVSKLQNALIIGNTLKELGDARVPFSWNVLRDAVTGNFNLADSDTDVEMDAINQEFDSIDFDAVDLEIIAYLDSIGVNEPTINDMLSDKDDYSVSASIVVADSISKQFDDEAIFDSAVSFAMDVNLDDFECDAIDTPITGGKGRGDMEVLDEPQDAGDGKKVVAKGKDGQGRDKALVKDDEGNLKGVTKDASNMPKRKPGYKREMVVRDGKKKWVNKRINKDKKVKLSPKQKLALMKARRKSNTGNAKRKRAKSGKKRTNFGL